MIKTSQGVMHFQDFWVSYKGEPDVLGVKIKSIEKAKPTEEVKKALETDENVLIGPSNPITSIGPILALKGIRKILEKKKVIAVSPIIGNSPVSGPAGKFMKACGFPVSSKGVAQCYGDVVDALVIDEKDANDKDLGIRTVRLDTLMTSIEKSEALAGAILELFRDIG